MNTSHVPRAVRPLRDGRVALVAWSSRLASFAVFICKGPLEESCISSAQELDIRPRLDTEESASPTIWELEDGLVLVLQSRVLFWSAETVFRSGPGLPFAQWSGNIRGSAALRSGGLAVKSCNATRDSRPCQHMVLRMSKSPAGVSALSLRPVSPTPAEEGLYEKLVALPDGGLAIATRYGKIGACELDVVVFTAAALISGANASGRAHVLLPPRDPCNFGEDMLATEFISAESEYLLLFSDAMMYRFPVVQGEVGQVIAEPLPECLSRPTGVLLLPQGFLAVASSWSVRLLSLKDRTSRD